MEPTQFFVNFDKLNIEYIWIGVFNNNGMLQHIFHTEAHCYCN